jgi:outer membrane protein assembly factor BamD (BamD/ComL family)
MRGLLAEHEYLVGHFYLRRKAWRAAKGRMDTILTAYPEYAGLDKVLYEAGLLETKMGNKDGARTLWERLARDYPASPLVRKLPAPPALAAAPVRAAGG